MDNQTTYTVYILRTSGNTLYIGQTKDLAKRLATHRTKSPKASKYVRSFPFFELVYTETAATRSEALKREWQLKQLSRPEKEALILKK
jgi:putative endonuclease